MSSDNIFMLSFLDRRTAAREIDRMIRTIPRISRNKMTQIAYYHYARAVLRITVGVCGLTATLLGAHRSEGIRNQSIAFLCRYAFDMGILGYDDSIAIRDLAGKSIGAYRYHRQKLRRLIKTRPNNR